MNKSQDMDQDFDNTLLAEWTGPYNGVPAFDKMNVTDLKEAMVKGMEMNLAEIDAIVEISEDPTFENTILVMERAGEPSNRAFSYYGIWRSNMSTEEVREIQAELAPMISDFSSKIFE